MKVLVGCEQSQIVCKAFLDAGHDSYSCDIEPCTGGLPDRHIQQDVRHVMYRSGWDLFICHPVCQYLANSGVKHLMIDPLRWVKLFEAADFFLEVLNADIPKVVIENPVMHKYAKRLIGRDYDQLIQPHQFSHKEQKATCLWLKGVNPLVPVTNLKWETKQLPKSEGQRLHWLAPGKERTRIRSQTYQGVANEMARQWGSDVQTHLFANG